MPGTINLQFENNSLLPLLYGEHNAHLHYLEKKLDITIMDRGNKITLQGADAATHTAQAILLEMLEKIEKNQEVSTSDIDTHLRFLNDTKPAKKKAKMSSPTKHKVKTKKKTIEPRSPKQAEYMAAIEKHDMVFGVGPAGTGKTYIAVCMAVAQYLNGDVERLIFCRPALEAGEKIGFLPGDMKEKIDPYLRPVYDALHDMMPRETVQKKIEAGEIEIAPLAFMRGRTLSNAFVILDEAQNATSAQVKMFLTRLGEASKMVITGDPDQTDLPKNIESGLSEAIKILRDTPEIHFTTFTSDDVVRHDLVSKIIKAYDRYQKR